MIDSVVVDVIHVTVDLVSLWQDDLFSVAHFIAEYFDHFQSGGDPS
jgi:hypothetical protein